MTIDRQPTQGTYQVLEIGSVVDGVPDDRELDVYVQSDIDVQATPISQPTLGDDSNSGLSSTSPLRTLHAVERKFGTHAKHGQLIHVHLGGGGLIAPFTNPTGVRYYQVMDVEVGGGECFRPSVRWSGPDPMYRVTGGTETLTIASVVNGGPLNLSTVITFNEATLGPPHSLAGGRFLRMIHTPTGFEFFFPLPISAQPTSSQVVIDMGPAAASITPYIGVITCSIVQPAAQIVNRGPGASLDGVWIRGQGAFDAGGMVGVRNHLYNFRRLAIERARVSGDGISFENCWFYTGTNQDTVFRGGWIRTMSCAVYGDLHWRCGGTSVADGTGTAAENLRGFAVAHAGPPFPGTGNNPMFPTSGIALQICDGRLIVGNATEVGRLLSPFGISVRTPIGSTGGAAIVVNGPGSMFQALSTAVFCAGADTVNHAAVGLRVRNGGYAVIDDTDGVAAILSSVTPLRLGSGAGSNVALGTGAGGLRQATGYNGRASRDGNVIADQFHSSV